MRPSWPVEGDETTIAREDAAAHQAARARGRGAVDDVQQPLVHAERPVEPHHVVQAGDPHLGIDPGALVRSHRGRHKGKVRAVGEQVAMQRRIVGQGSGGTQPHRVRGRALVRREGIDRIDRPQLNRPLGKGAQACAFR